MISEKTKHLILFLLVVAIYYTYATLQPTVDYDSTIPYDGKQYSTIAHHFSSDSTDFSVVFPFNSRIGVPFIVSLLPASYAVSGFTILNTLCLTLFYVTFVYFLKTYAKASFEHIAFAVLWLSLHFTGPLRYYLHDPIGVDLQIMVIEGLVVLSFFNKKSIALIGLAVLGIFVKESIIPLLVILSISSFFFHKKQLLTSLITALILTIIIKSIIGHFFPPAIANWKYNSVITLLFRMKFLILHPTEILQFLSSLVFIGSLFLIKIRPIKKLNNEQKSILLIALYGIGITILGGKDYTRILFISSIYIFTALLIFLKNTSHREFIYLLIGSLPFLRVFTVLPEQYSYKTFPEYFDVTTCLIWLSYFILAFIIYKYTKRTNAVAQE